MFTSPLIITSTPYNQYHSIMQSNRRKIQTGISTYYEIHKNPAKQHQTSCIA